MSQLQSQYPDQQLWQCLGCGLRLPLPVFPLECSCGRFYRAAEEGCTDPPAFPPHLICADRGELTGESLPCSSCGNREGRAPLYWCLRHREGVLLKRAAGSPGVRNCLDCLCESEES